MNGKDTEHRAEGLIDYYDRLACHYDADRFGGSYGQYLDAQERRLLRSWLAPVQGGQILDLACGTGRLLEFATHGRDASKSMVRIACEKHPGKTISCGLASDPADLDLRFNAIFCVHLFMHLSMPSIESVIATCFEQLKPGGVLIFDVPSAERRGLTGFHPVDWHAGTALSRHQVGAMQQGKWRLQGSRGVLFLPIHRLPASVRHLFRPLDDWMGRLPCKWWSSYVFYCLKRNT